MPESLPIVVPDSTPTKPAPHARVESFNGKLRDELLDRELFLSMTEARYVVYEWRLEYNHHRPHGGLGWQTPASYAAKIDDRAAGVFPAATRAEPAFGAASLRTFQFSVLAAARGVRRVVAGVWLDAPCGRRRVVS